MDQKTKQILSVSTQNMNSEMNLAERIMTVDKSEITTELITTINVCDVSEVKDETELFFYERGSVITQG